MSYVYPDEWLFWYLTRSFVSYHLPTVHVSFEFQEINLLGSKFLTIALFLNPFLISDFGSWWFSSWKMILWIGIVNFVKIIGWFNQQATIQKLSEWISSEWINVRLWCCMDDNAVFRWLVIWIASHEVQVQTSAVT